MLRANKNVVVIPNSAYIVHWGMICPAKTRGASTWPGDELSETFLLGVSVAMHVCIYTSLSRSSYCAVGHDLPG